MISWFTFAVSLLALTVAGITAWLTFFRKGKLLMTQPTTVFFGPDGRSGPAPKKVYLRTLLYSTAKRGQVVESLHVSLHRGESKQNFSIWVYGEPGNWKRGSGIFVPQEGVTFNHNFLLPKGTNYGWLPGNYRLTVFAKLVRDAAPHELFSLKLSVTEAQAKALEQQNAGIHFDWGPDLQGYYSHVDFPPKDEPVKQSEPVGPNS